MALIGGLKFVVMYWPEGILTGGDNEINAVITFHDVTFRMKYDRSLWFIFFQSESTMVCMEIPGSLAGELSL